MKKVVIIGAVAFGILSLAPIWLIGPVLFGMVWGGSRTLATNLPVTTEWTEIKINPPVKPTYNRQAIYLRPVNFEVDRVAKGFEIRLPDGTVVEPEVEIYNEHGKMFQMHKTGFAMGWNDYVEFWPGAKNDYLDLPRNRTYPSLRIRSDVPFICERIMWIDYDAP